VASSNSAQCCILKWCDSLCGYVLSAVQCLVTGCSEDKVIFNLEINYT
jgi:hypothetical protein